MTPAQHNFMLFLQREIEVHGYPPTYRRIAAALGFASIGSVDRLVAELVRKGYLRRSFREHRSLEIITRVPDPLDDRRFAEAGRAAVRALPVVYSEDHAQRASRAIRAVFQGGRA